MVHGEGVVVRGWGLDPEFRDIQDQDLIFSLLSHRTFV